MNGTSSHLSATLLSSILLAGCGEDSGRGGDDVGVSLTGISATAADGGTSDATGDGGDGGDESGEKLDQGGGSGPMGMGCDKIDFLFVVDNSVSMEDEQANLITSFPGFIDGISTSIEGVEDFHVGVVTSDTYAAAPQHCRFVGGLVIETGGAFSSDSVCGPYAEGENYMTEVDDLNATFSCAARVGASGQAIERPMDAAIAAITGVGAGPGECNEGFLRDDALLVLVVITDEWDGPDDPEGQTSAGTPQQWYDTIIDAKGGATQVAAVTLVNEGNVCPPPEPFNDGVRLVEFTALFGGNGFLGGVCQPDYGPVFSNAIDVVADACAGFVPAG